MLAPMPAPLWTRTEWRPPAVSFFTVSGVAATRVSPGLVSAGMPMRIELNPSGCAWSQLHVAPCLILYDAQPIDLGLTDKVAIVTGSSRGLGLGFAKALAEGWWRDTVIGP